MSKPKTDKTLTFEAALADLMSGRSHLTRRMLGAEAEGEGGPDAGGGESFSPSVHVTGGWFAHHPHS